MRFPGFTDQWTRIQISTTCDILCGYAFDGNSIVEYETSHRLLRGVNITEGVIRHSSDLDRYIAGVLDVRLDKYILHDGDLVIGMDGSKVGKNTAIITKKDSGAYLVQRVCRLRADSMIISLIFHQINNPRFHKYVDNVKTSSAIPHISQSDISNYYISFTSNPEERDKIVTLLNSIDERIATQRRLIEDFISLRRAILQDAIKRGLSKKSWKFTTLSDILTERGERNSEGYDVCSVSVSEGVVNQIEYLGRSFAAKETGHYNVARYGDIIYTKSPTGSFPYGIVKRDTQKEPAAISPLYGVFVPKHDWIGILLGFYFESEVNTFNYLHPIIQKGAKNTINITNSGFLANSVPLPIGEREALTLAKCLDTISNKIVLEKSVFAHYIEQREYLLSKMFV